MQEDLRYNRKTFMHKYIVTLLILLTGSAIQAQSALTPKSSITDVLVYRSGAEITRTASVNLSAGSNDLVLKGLSRNIDAQSIQISGLDGAQINYVNLERDYLSEVPIPSDIQELLDQHEDSQFKLNIRKRVATAYAEEKKLLLANQKVLGDESELTVTDLVQLADLYRTRLKEIELKSLEIENEIEELSTTVKKLERQLGSWKNLPDQSQNTLSIGLQSATSKSLSLQVQYLVYDAGWNPSYDIIAKNNSQSLDWVYKAQVSQSTGVNWDKVNLSFSTGSPSASGNLPQLSTDYVDIVRPQPVSQSTRENVKLVTADLISSQVQSDKYPGFKATEGNVNTYFSTSNTYSIRSYGKPVSVALDTRQLEASFQYIAIPKVNTAAYLSANVSNFERLSLLPGEANMYYEGALTGSAYIDPNSVDGALQLPLGKDPQVAVERKAVNDVSKGGNLISSNKKSFHYEIVVKNNKRSKIAVKVQDQIPVSKNTDVAVTLLESSGAAQNGQTGILTWNIDLDPGASKTLTLKYEIKFPKGERINR